MIPPVISPVKLYQQLFVEDTPEAKATAVHRLKDDRSLLDRLREKARRLEREVGPADRERLDQYFTSVRELERRLATAEGWIGKAEPKVSAAKPDEINDRNDLPKNDRVMFDLAAPRTGDGQHAHCHDCVQSRRRDAAHHSRRECNTHELTHHGNRPEKINELRLIEQAQFHDLAAFLRGLARRIGAGRQLARAHGRPLRHEHGQRQRPLDRQSARTARRRRFQTRPAPCV